MHSNTIVLAEFLNVASIGWIAVVGWPMQDAEARRVLDEGLGRPAAVQLFRRQGAPKL